MAEVQAELIIFDCDGVLVDSELLSTHTTARLLTEIGFAIDAEGVAEQFLGHSLKQLAASVSRQMGRPLPDGFIDQVRAEIAVAFHRELRPVPGIADLLAALDQAARKRCVASSSMPDRIRLSLSLTGLLPWLEPHLFSASMVANGKPAPDLFLLAADRLGVAPFDCVVIEDSVAGVTAATAAGMRCIGFVGGSHLQPAKAGPCLLQAGASVVAQDAQHLAALLVG